MKKSRKKEYKQWLLNFLKDKAKLLKTNKTTWETSLYTTLKDLHYKFNFQVPVICAEKHGYILDFLLIDYNLIIEVDGKAFHSSPEQRKKDNLRTRRLKKEGFHLIRLSNKQVSVLTKEQIHDIISTKILHIVNKR